MLALELDMPGEQRWARVEGQVRDRHGDGRADDRKQACLGYEALPCRLVARKLEDQPVINIDSNAVPADDRG
jgi:hypothetical protein